MRAGTLRHRVEIQSPTNTTEADGTFSSSWTTETTRWASVDPVSGDELSRSNQKVGELTHQVTMRHVDTLPSSYRLLWGSRVFNIVTSRNLNERDRTTLLLCREVTT